jgi:hypothetical protein
MKEFKKKNAHVYRFSNSHLTTFVAPAQDVYPHPAWKISVVWCGWRLLGFALCVRRRLRESSLCRLAGDKWKLPNCNISKFSGQNAKSLRPAGRASVLGRVLFRMAPSTPGILIESNETMIVFGAILGARRHGWHSVGRS